MRWMISHKGDPAALKLADRHYSRQSVGSDQFLPPGRSLVLLTRCKRAVWASLEQRYSMHAWPDSWLCPIFRNESDLLSSELINDAVRATLFYWRGRPPRGFLTFVDGGKVNSSVPGACFRAAGFRRIGETRKGLLVLGLAVDRLPRPEAPIGGQFSLFGDVTGPADTADEP